MSRRPLVSIIMPVRDEESYIERSLGAVLAQDWPRARIEVFVADGMSDDGTRAAIERVRQRAPDLPVYVLDNPRRTFSAGFNVGLERARGDVVIMLGGHTVIDPDFVSRSVAALDATGADCVGGLIRTVSETPTSETIAVAMSSRFGVGGVAFRMEEGEAGPVDTVAFGAYRRATVDRAGPLDEELVRNQDDEYNYRIRDLGGTIFLVPGIRSTYFARTSLPRLWSQYMQYGYWKVRVMQKHPRQMRPRHLVPPLFAATLILAAGALFTPLGWWAFALVGGAYAVANLAASVATASRRGWRHLPLLPVVFAALHLSYGLGFLRGLFAFAPRFFGRAADRAAEAA